MNTIKRSIIHTLALGGAFALVRGATRRLPRVLMYHGFRDAHAPSCGRIPGAMFERQLRYIRRHFSPMKMGDLVRHHQEHGRYPERAVVITVDDGYESFHSIALPLLKRYEIPATVYVVADAAERSGWIWCDILNHSFEQLQRQGTDILPETRIDTLRRIETLPAADRAVALDGFLDEHGIELPPAPPAEYRLMSWDQLREAVASGLVEIGGHTATHTIVSHLDEDDFRLEVIDSKRLIQDRLDIEVTAFSYPNGQPGDYTPANMRAIRQAGYTSCVATHSGLIDPHTDIFAMPRIVTDPHHFNVTRASLDGFFHAYIRWRSSMNTA